MAAHRRVWTDRLHKSGGLHKQIRKDNLSLSLDHYEKVKKKARFQVLYDDKEIEISDTQWDNPHCYLKSNSLHSTL